MNPFYRKESVMIRQILYLLCTFSLLSGTVPASACLWDRDTLASEAKGIPDVIQVITGRFERNPPLYFEMRLKRVAAELEKRPQKLELYDDAGVACDRLGRSGEAIVWMEKKREQLEKSKLPKATLRDHWYRYYANLGTFRAHKWLHDGADRKQIGEMKQARNEIAKAIEINPDAHFGREKYQLKAMEWIIAPPKVNAQEGELPNLLRADYKVEAAPEAVKGLTGLIVLGNAWESVDVFHALAKAIQSHGDRSSPAYMARLRAGELIDKGRKSVLPDAPTQEGLKKLVVNQSGARYQLEEDKIKELEETFRKLRQEADKWHSHRTAYLMSQLQAGRHPDTHPDCWKGYRELPAPDIEEIASQQSQRYWLPGLLVAGVTIGGLLVVRRPRHAG
jgi:tetratricopeptide (TPR) repeat protein